MKHNWEYTDFNKIAQTITPNVKIDKSSYLENGVVPIVSQEDSLISGYWDNISDITPHKVPVLIFGDHSRVVKYVEFDFVVGADGVKIIQPKNCILTKFLYHYLKWYNVPSLGYSRHFKLLKEAKYPVPPMEVQERIVAELDEINGMIETKREQLKQLDLLAQSIFYTMFGDPISNPKGWSIFKIGDLTAVQTGATPLREDGNNYIGNIPWVKTTEVHNCRINSTEEHISEVALSNSNCKIFPIDTIILAMYGLGKTRGQVARLDIEASTNQACAAILPCKELNPTYLFNFLITQYEPLRNKAVGGNQKNLNLSIIKDYNIILPPLSLQEQFAAKVEAIESRKMDIEKTIKELQTLLDSRMDYWFN